MKSVKAIVNGMSDHYKGRFTMMWSDFKKYNPDAPGSSGNHQDWEGGYFDHIKAVMNHAIMLYEQLDKVSRLDFSLEDALVVLFLHDIEKPIKYVQTSDKHLYRRVLKSDDEIKKEIIDYYQVKLTQEHYDAIKYIHGEGDDYSKNKRVMSPLAAFCHCCDVMSARIFHDLCLPD